MGAQSNFGISPHDHKPTYTDKTIPDMENICFIDNST